jgi:hypothetical protein
MRLVAGIAALVAALGAAPIAAQNGRPELRQGETLLEVQATGVSRDRPDVMTIEAGVVTTGPTAAAALRQNSVVANRLIETVRARGVEPRDVRTTGLRVTPVFEPRSSEDNDDEQGRRIIGYTARNNVELRLRDLTRAPELLDAALQVGANNVEGPRFSLSNDRPAILRAQQDGIRLAREEANNYAQALGMRVSRVLRVSERGRHSGSEESIVVTGSRIRLAPIEPGELATEVTVWIDFALAPQ